MMKKSFWIIAVLLLVPALTLAAPRIVDVDFVGLVLVSETTVRSQIESIEGTPYSRSSIKRDIKKLYKSGLFSNVKVDKTSGSGGITLTYTLSEKQTVGNLKISGNKKIKDTEITEALKFQEYDSLDPAKIAQTKAEIYKLYEEKGYYLVDVKTEVIPFDEQKNQVEVLFKINENKPVKIRRIRFMGNKAFSDKKLRKKVRTKEKSLLTLLSGGGKLESEKLNADLQLLRFYFLDNGYLRAKVGTPSITLTRDKRSIYISIPVHEGNQYEVKHVGAAGDILTSEEEMQSKFHVRVGDVYSKSKEIEDVKMLEQMYGDQAYAFASIVPQVLGDDETQEATVMYYVQKGPKIKINKIRITGNDVTRDKVVRRELKIVENSYFSQSALELSKTRLYQLGYFEEINVSTPRGSRDNTVDIVIDVKEKNTGTFSIGAGFSTLESFIFTATIQKENFFGRGWSGGISANLSKLRQDIIVSMSDQKFLDSQWFLGLSFQRYLSQLNSDFDRNLFGGSVTSGRELFDFFHFRFGYRLEDIAVTNFSSAVPQFFQDNASGLISAAFASVTYDRRDNRIVTKKGFYSKFLTEYSTEALGANTNYIKFDADQRIFIKLPKSFVLKGRGRFGYINSTEASPVPLYSRFFLGGINTLRGFDLNSVGPQISTPSSATGGDSAFTYGGNKMLLFNVELEVPIYAPAGFYVVTFFDSGNAFGEDENIDFSELRLNYGFGLRWLSPFGPLRFEWGFPIDKRENESSTVFNFTIGQSF
jgi:outer membrane protein insertion porin family